MMPVTCSNPWCQASFEVFPEDREFLNKFGIEKDPEECPDCRHQKRGMFYPQLTFHRRTSSLSGEPMLSIYSERCRFPVYSISEWWSDRYDALTYGRLFDFTRSFFGQFEILWQEVPQMANEQDGNTENADYSFSAGNSKNVYYSVVVYRSEEMYYCERTTGYNTMLFDCLKCYRCSQLYECVQCRNCYSSSFLHQCIETRDSHFCIDCRGCSDCLFCCNLRNKSFHIGNTPYAKEEYERLKTQFINGKYATHLQNLERWKELRARTIWRNLWNENSENCRGDALTNCANCYECYHCQNAENDRYCRMLTPSEKNVSSMDLTTGGIGELLYNSIGLGGGNYFLRMCVFCRQCSDLTYCIHCYSCRDCFGCTGLKSKRYCILNKQFTKEEYEKFVPIIIANMKMSGEWGQFFPVSFTPFAYNESFAMIVSPLTKEEILRRGWRWEDPPELLEGIPSIDDVADSIDDVSDDICKKVLTSTISGKKHKIIPQELAFYRSMRIPIPREHPDERMARRRGMMNPYRLWTRACSKCGKAMETSFSPQRLEIVYCESCYLQTVY
ncbi:hypothetical protein HY213_04165 [Candidatus Peregrinibacteria bacterium]|nr:hypothetical protein [Candidatus Peregrinibacteria bacterium]